MRSESNKIEKNDDIDRVLSSIYDNYDAAKFSATKIHQMIKKRVTKQMLANYLKEIQFSGFGKDGFRDLEDLSAQFWYDYVRHFDEYEDIIIECLEYLVRQFPKKELLYAINILGGRISPNADMYTVRETMKNELLKSDDEYYESFIDGCEMEAIFDVYNLFEKWFFPNQLQGHRVAPRKNIRVRRSPRITVNVRRMF